MLAGMYERVEIPTKLAYNVRAKRILDELEEIAYAKALKIPLESARAEILQAALNKEAKRRGKRARTKVEGNSLLAWVE